MATILISDDRPQRRRYLATLLERQGHEILEAGSSVETLTLTRSRTPDLVLINVLMPPPGGYHFLGQLREKPELVLPRVVFLAAPYMAGEATLLGHTCGVSRVVTDSADRETLFATVNAALGDPPPGPAVPLADNVDGERLYPMVIRLHGRVTELEIFNARLQRTIAVTAALLNTARAALDCEIGKRLWFEEEMRRENRRLRLRTMRDSMTGLYNHRHFEESFVREESRAKRSGKPLGLMMIDIDDLKLYNDRYDHTVGNIVLRAVCNFMMTHTRAGDILCRYGSDEFLLMMTDTGEEMLRRRAEALRTGVRQLVIESRQGRVGPVTLSIGLALFPAHGNTTQAVLEAADAALRDAKKAGQDRIGICSTMQMDVV